MLNILANQGSRFCDGVSRRNFLKVGGLALGGLSLPQMLQAEAASGVRSSNKAIIMIFLPGGPPHQDMWDLKPDAPAEIRGEFNPISTSVSGIQICEQFPRIAARMEKFVPIRTIVGATGSHYAFQCHTGHSHQQQPQGGWPSLGSVMSRVYGPAHPSVPAFVGLAPPMGHMPWADPGQAGFLGVSHSPFKPNDAQGRADMVLNGIDMSRLQNRQQLLSSLDRFRREVDGSGMMEGMDSFTQQAFGVLTSSRLLQALDISREEQSVRDRYGRGVGTNRDDGGPRQTEHFLMARRLVEAGVRCVTLAFSRWDWHGANFRQGREDMPLLDQGVSALVDDLEQRGMLDDVSVVVWGEFGRTPKINNSAGRDHWPQVSCALLAGGGINAGQVIGQTNRLGEVPQSRPVHFQEVFATLYKNLGINVDQVTLRDLSGRPQYLVDRDYRALPELV